MNTKKIFRVFSYTILFFISLFFVACQNNDDAFEALSNELEQLQKQQREYNLKLEKQENDFAKQLERLREELAKFVKENAELKKSLPADFDTFVDSKLSAKILELETQLLAKLEAKILEISSKNQPSNVDVEIAALREDLGGLITLRNKNLQSLLVQQITSLEAQLAVLDSKQAQSADIQKDLSAEITSLKERIVVLEKKLKEIEALSAPQEKGDNSSL